MDVARRGGWRTGLDRSWRAIALCAAACAVIATVPVTGAALAAGKDDSTTPAQRKSTVNDAWSSRTDTHPEPAATDAASPQCQTLNRNVMAKVASIKALRDQIAKEKLAPPKTVVGALQQMMGEEYTSATETKSNRKIAETRKSADELNDLLAAASCQRVDIDGELSKAATADQSLQAPTTVTPQTLDKRDRTIFDEPSRY